MWASTSTKNPAFSPTLYVDELIGPRTVNTLPDSTLEAFAASGTLARTIDSGVDDAQSHIERVTDAGVDLESVAQQLEREGLASFQTSFDDLLAALSAKRSGR
ncbi:MAG: transaldolase family protein [Actinomycetota bacterium]